MNSRKVFLTVLLTAVLPAASWAQLQPAGPEFPLCGPAPEPDGSCRRAASGGAGKSSVQIKNLLDNVTHSRGCATF